MNKINPRVYPASIIIQQGFDVGSLPNVKIRTKGKHKLFYVRACCGFDIETSQIFETKEAYMYIWQFAFNDIVVIGRTWEEFAEVLEVLKEQYKLNTSKRLIIWIANLPFEFQFLRHRFNITDVFAKEVRKPLYAVIDDCIELRDCLTISGGSLEQLAKDYTQTKKLVGDLDYQKSAITGKLRNSKTPLTKEELQYCINDVVILSEWADYIFSEYAEPKKYIPLTKTGIIRRDIKAGISYEQKKHIYEQYPETFTLYKDWFQYLFRGGYVHANLFYANKILDDVAGVDITSSYPAQINFRPMPVSRFRRVNPAELDKYINTHCCIIKARFKGMKNRFAHSIESKSKVIFVKNPTIDNGRILKADECISLLTELDYKVYDMFYTFESVEILSLEVATRGFLPAYMTEPMNKAYIKKDELKKAGLSETPEYAQQKSYVNSVYGCTVTRLCVEEIVLQNGEWCTDATSFDFERERKKAFMLPQWGIWITSWARFQLLSTVYAIECEATAKDGDIKNPCGDVIYCDTDSIKMMNYDKHKATIDRINKEIGEQMKQRILSQNLPFEHFDNLGQFDLEYEHATMKTLGAKRYITTYADGKTKVTVAGLPKKALTNYCAETGADIYDMFDDGLLMSIDIAMKNASCYNDEPTEAIIDGERMQELSSICIFPIPFSLKLDKIYKLMLENIERKEQKYEKRIY